MPGDLLPGPPWQLKEWREKLHAGERGARVQVCAQRRRASLLCAPPQGLGGQDVRGLCRGVCTAEERAWFAPLFCRNLPRPSEGAGMRSLSSHLLTLQSTYCVSDTELSPIDAFFYFSQTCKVGIVIISFTEEEGRPIKVIWFILGHTYRVSKYLFKD